MRLNALISASLSLVLLSPGHSLLAASAHRAHHVAAHGKAVSSTTAGKTAKQKATATKAAAGRRKTVSSASVKRTSATSPSNRKKTSLRATVKTASARSSRKATSQDFVEAASGRTNGRGAVVEARATPTAKNSRMLAVANASDLDNSKAATQSAASVTRAATVHPALEQVEQEAATPIILPTLYNKRGRLIMPPPMRGSHEILVRQNVMADRDGLDRIQNDDDLSQMVAQRLLVRIPESGALAVDDRLSPERRTARPWTVAFLTTLARAHYARFHTPLNITSAVRTVEFQQRLQRTNGNAAPTEGETASPHLTGQAIDLGKHGLSMTEIAWLRGYLLPLSQQGRIDVEEEFQQACFHISVYKRYMPSTRREVKAGDHGGITALATGLR